MNRAAPALEVDKIHAWRGDRHVLKNVSTRVSSGELLLISGANGAGKTTLLRIISGLSRPEQGSVRWSGIDISRQRPEYQSVMTFSAHEPALKSDLTALENLHFSIALRRQTNAMELRRCLEQTDVSSCADLPARALSAGQRRRVAMARVLATQTSLWLLDEPYANLDAAGHELVSRLLGAHVRQGGTAIVVAHHEVTIDCPVSRLHLT